MAGQMKKCPCCGKMFDTRGFKVHVLFCCGGKTLSGIIKSFIKK